ncbi:hypothetical protein V8D89_006959 [Ganoderma adspersum]
MQWAGVDGNVREKGQKQDLTEDWALVELDHGGKFDWDPFWGNIIHLGGLILTIDRIQVSNSTSTDYDEDVHPHVETGANFKYPPVAHPVHLRQLTMLDANGEECLIALKNGASTGATLGRATDIESFLRQYDENGAIRSRSLADASPEAK